MKKIHYSWYVCAGCTLLLFCTAGLLVTAFSVYQPYILEHGHFTNAQGSTIITIRSLAALISFLFVERYYRKLDIRLGVTVATFGAVVGFVLFGIANDFVMYSIAAAVIGVAYGLGAMIPASIMIGRWFHTHKALALGIGMAGTGVAGIITPPILTALVESVSLQFAFFLEAGFLGVMAVLIFVILRNRPEEMGLAPLCAGDSEEVLPQQKTASPASRGIILAMLASVVLIGMIAQPGFSHLSVLFKTEGYNSMTVAFLISLVAVTLTAGKIIYGRITDRMGAYRSGFLFFGVLIVGATLSCFSGQGRIGVALAAMFFLGLGLPLGTVGLSVFAADVSTAADYGKMVKRFQMAYLTGSLVFGPVPGLIADATGSYIPFYVLLILFAALAMALVQLSYRRMNARRQAGVVTTKVVPTGTL